MIELQEYKVFEELLAFSLIVFALSWKKVDSPSPKARLI